GTNLSYFECSLLNSGGGFDSIAHTQNQRGRIGTIRPLWFCVVIPMGFEPILPARELVIVDKHTVIIKIRFVRVASNLPLSATHPQLFQDQEFHADPAFFQSLFPERSYNQRFSFQPYWRYF
ncbi:MAG: hypothetical protein P8X55_14635, partial [Desulfosarcinaceae bacterium]